MQIRKNNFILLVFNSVVSAFLLFMLLRFLLGRRKKNSVPSLKDYAATSSIIPDPDSFTNQNKIGRHLDQLERIIKLRDTGTLTEEEFLKQKHIILENGN